jgi:uncharacterized RDD family membrane protein YckC
VSGSTPSTDPTDAAPDRPPEPAPEPASGLNSWASSTPVAASDDLTPLPAAGVATHAWGSSSEVRPGPAPGFAYVGFWRRVAAWLIDGFILGIGVTVLFVVYVVAIFVQLYRVPTVIDPATGSALTATQAELMSAFGPILGLTFAFYGVVFLVFAAYHVLLWAYLGGTIGQRVLGMEVRREADGGRIGFWRACLRYIGLIISWWAFGIGLLWVGFDARSQGWHDKIASTFVIRRA